MLNHINSPDKLLYFYIRAAWVEDSFTKKLKQHQRPSCDLFVAISKIPLPFTTGTCFKHLMQVKYQLLLIHIIENKQNVKLWEKKTQVLLWQYWPRQHFPEKALHLCKHLTWRRKWTHCYGLRYEITGIERSKVMLGEEQNKLFSGNSESFLLRWLCIVQLTEKRGRETLLFLQWESI